MSWATPGDAAPAAPGLAGPGGPVFRRELSRAFTDGLSPRTHHPNLRQLVLQFVLSGLTVWRYRPSWLVILAERDLGY